MKNLTSGLATRRPWAATWAIALVFLGVAGCAKGQKSSTSLAPVAGTVKLDDKPLAEAALEFVPNGDTHGQGGAASSDEAGHFVVTTPFGEEGLPPGEYRVIISKLVLPQDMHFDIPPDKNLPPIETPYRESLPLRYADRMNSKLSVKVAPSGTDKMVFTLRSGKK
ncbi:hypothetical protein SAMN05444166_3785 [Singulisphaera sp. GP187]|uniref:carboxypeptidase-like regulatory domain-containing protein n=1 Tax=Singulisphaera sp. GP187 TaxID=1882752 RepID=UPI0009286471|nr:carboxypeptidase-like regulatory domain-containing protein [Singulisphaera sp. GP187]SIO32385.1 hypothetical protein SAMN05444166_3785 [Singulisphaera sp. GP187]